MVTQNSANNKTGASGTILQGQGVGTASDFSTATYPATTTINQVLYSSSANVVGEIATANNGVMIANNSGVPSMLAAGTVDYVLTANTAAPPSWKSSSGYVANFVSISTFGPADSQTYYIPNAASYNPTVIANIGNSIFYIPVAGTINIAYGVTTVQGTLGSAGNMTFRIRLNASTTTDITTTAVATAASNTFNNTSLGITVAAGDYIEVQWITPAWATNPTNVGVSIAIYVE